MDFNYFCFLIYLVLINVILYLDIDYLIDMIFSIEFLLTIFDFMEWLFWLLYYLFNLN